MDSECESNHESDITCSERIFDPGLNFSTFPISPIKAFPIKKLSSSFSDGLSQTGISCSSPIKEENGTLEM